MKLAAALLVAFAAAANGQVTKQAWDKEPEAFLGIRLGQRMEVQACPSKSLGTLKPAIQIMDYAALEKVNGVCYDPTSLLNSDSLYQLHNLPSLGIAYRATLRVKDGVVSEIDIDLKQSGFHVLYDALQQRYGRPTIAGSSIVKNNAGAEFSSLEAAWQGVKMTITAYERLGRIDESYVSVQDAAIAARDAAALRAKRAAEAQKF